MASDDTPPLHKDVLELNYETSLMYGSYSRNLGEYAKEQAARLRKSGANDETTTREIEHSRRNAQTNQPKKWIPDINRLPRLILNQTFAKVGEDWVFLVLLGVIMALISFAVDFGIYMCVYARLWIYREAIYHPALQYLAWVILPVGLIWFASSFVFFVAPQAVGSGIPEMKTILRGVVLKEYLTFPTLIAKAVGLTATLGSGMPLGKEGPLVHIGSIVGTLLSKHLSSFKGIYENQARKNDMLAAACAVGVSSSLGAPIGGVLFSIEVTSSHFAVRNYWRGFFSAACSALMYRLLSYWFNTEETLTAVFPTNFKIDFPYDPFELFIFAIIGVFGGLFGACFVLMHRRFSLFVRTNKRVSTFLKKNRLIYPGVISFIVATVFFPLGSGRYLATTQSNKQHLSILFANFTWMGDDLTPEQAEELAVHWDAGNTNLFFSLGAFMMSVFFMNLLANTLPVPHGSFVPIFKMGAGFGRMIGEAMCLWFPEGIRTGSLIFPVLPGGYAIVGAAAVSAGVTHTVSICVVVSEMTGQIHHIIPILVAVLISNAVSSLLQPSLYESIIIIKKLPYLPSIRPSTSGVHDIHAEDFMNRDIKYVWKGMTYEKLKNIVEENKEIRSFPLLNAREQMVLLGSIQRTELSKLLDHHIGSERRLEVAAQRHWEAKSRERKRKVGLLLSHFAQPPPVKLLETCDTLIAQDSNSLASSSDESGGFSTISTLDTNEDNDASIQSSESSSSKASSAESRRTSRSIFNVPKSMANIDVKQFKSFSTLKGSIAFKRRSIAGVMEAEQQSGKVGKPFRRKSSGWKDLRKISLIDKMTSIPIVYPAYFKKSQQNSAINKAQIIDMSEEEKQEWENLELAKVVDFRTCTVDAAPFQLVARTSLLKVHNIFSLLGLRQAYVTDLGKLIGIVSLVEMRKAVEDVNSGKLVPKVFPTKVTLNVSYDEKDPEIPQPN